MTLISMNALRFYFRFFFCNYYIYKVYTILFIKSIISVFLKKIIPSLFACTLNYCPNKIRFLTKGYGISCPIDV